MGSGSSVLNQTKVIEEVRKKYEQDPLQTTKVVNACKKEIRKLNRQAKNFVPPSDNELVEKFKLMDFNGNNIVSLAEIDKYISEGYPLFDNKPALMRAYKAADYNRNGFVSLKEFKNLWKYIVFFNKLWEKFEEIDYDHDRRITFKEFKDLSKSLFGTELSEKEAKYYFNLIDINDGGMILFNEFCAFMVRRKIALE
jgi:Ca2+-binding EF-hand superfamily protein